MAIDFPTNPSTGDQVTGPYGEIYTWDGQAWSITGATSPIIVPPEGGTIDGPVDLVVQNVTQSGADLAIDRSLGENCSLSLTAPITAIAVTNWPAAGFTGKVRLVIINTGAFTIGGWPAGTKWPGGTAPTITPSGTDIILLMSDNAGATIYGSVVGQGYA